MLAVTPMPALLMASRMPCSVLLLLSMVTFLVASAVALKAGLT